jgi:hypothetical protein
MTESKQTKQVINKAPESDSDSDQPIVVNESKTSKTKKQVIKPSESDSDSDQPIVVNESKTKKQDSNQSDVENDSDESDVDDPKYNKKPVEKKVKDTHSELVTKLSEISIKKKEIGKNISTHKDALNKMYKEDHDLDKESVKLINLLAKTHTDEVAKAVKNKSKRSGNGGFAVKPVPEILYNFIVSNCDLLVSNDKYSALLKELDYDSEKCRVLGRPRVFKYLNLIFGHRGLRKGQVVTLDKQTCTDLGLDVTSRTLEFHQVHTFISEFYTA